MKRLTKKTDEENNSPDSTKKEKLGILDHILEHPNISAITGSVGFFIYNNQSIIRQYHKFGELDRYVSNFWLPALGLMGYQFLVLRGAISPMSKIATPKFKNIVKLRKLQKKVRAEYDSQKSNGNLESTLNDIKKCYGENHKQFYAYLSSLQIEFGEYEKGIENFIRYLRNANKSEIGFSFFPSDIINEGLMISHRLIKRELKRFLGKLSPIQEKSLTYEMLIASLNFNPKTKRGIVFAKQLNKMYHTLDDKLAYGNVMTYLDKPNEEHWRPFFEKLAEKLHEEGLSLEDLAEKETDTRNKIYKVRNIYLKEFEDSEGLLKEIRNTDHFKRLKHVVSRLIHVDFDGKNYLISPESGPTLDKLIDELETSKREKVLEKAIENLEEIHLRGNQLENVKVDEEHYLQRIRNLTQPYIENDDEFLSKYENEIIKVIANLDVMYYKDHNLKNILYEDEIVREIDFEHNLMKPPGIDMISALEFGKYHDEEFSKEMIIKYHQDMKNRLSYDQPDFIKFHEYLRVQRHLELAGYRSRVSSSNPNVQFHLEKAIDALENIAQHNHSENLPHLIQFLSKSVENLYS